MTGAPRAVVCGYGEMATVGLETLHDAGFDVPLLLTHEDDPGETAWWRSAADWARARGVDVSTSERPGGDETLRRVAALRPDFLFSFYYRSLLPPAFLALGPRGALNLHGSLLPRYRGRAPVNWVLVRGETATGVTLHYMDEKPDHGDLVAQAEVAIDPSDTALTLSRKLAAAAAALLRRTLPLLREGRAARVPQDHARATYFGRRTPADGRIDWSESATRIYDLVRAVTRPWPGAFTDFDGRRLFVWWGSATGGGGRGGAVPGRVLGSADGGVLIACGEGAFLAQHVEAEGAGPLQGAAVAGLLRPGARLG